MLDCVFYQRLNRDGILPPEDIKHIFINLEEIIQLHGNVNHRIERGRIISVMQLSHYLNCHNNHKNLNVCISELLLSLLHSFCNRADDSDQEEE